jgi:hypothetical protein
MSPGPKTLPAFSLFLDCAFFHYFVLLGEGLDANLCFYLLSSWPGPELTVFHSGVKDLDSNALLSCAWIISV